MQFSHQCYFTQISSSLKTETVIVLTIELQHILLYSCSLSEVRINDCLPHAVRCCSDWTIWGPNLDRVILGLLTLTAHLFDVVVQFIIFRGLRVSRNKRNVVHHHRGYDHRQYILQLQSQAIL